MKNRTGQTMVESTRALLDSALDHCRKLVLESGPGRVMQKVGLDGPPEPVTELDRSIEEYLIHAIQDGHARAAIVAEETCADMDLLAAEMCFVIDPIDGTREFLSGGDGFCISVALLENRRPILAVLDFPARRERFWAQKGSGATLNGRRIRVSTVENGSALRITISPAQEADRRFVDFRAGLPETRLEPFGGLSSKLVGVAAGLHDAAFFLDWEGYRAFAWDFAASGLVLEEAGGRLTGLDGTALLDSMPAVHQGGWLASNGFCHDHLLARLEKIRRSSMGCSACVAKR